MSEIKELINDTSAQCCCSNTRSAFASCSSETLSEQQNKCNTSDEYKKKLDYTKNLIHTKSEQIIEQVNHPAHYQSKNRIEVIDIIESFELGFNLGNVIKYILRSDRKNSVIQDLEKAKWYLEREISRKREQS